MMELLKELIDIILHIDIHLQQWVTDYRTWTYLILFIIVFMETGFVVTPFLPGDSLLFAAGTIAAMPSHPLLITALLPLFLAAAFGGDNANYWTGRILGHKVYEKNPLFLRKAWRKNHHHCPVHANYQDFCPICGRCGNDALSAVYLLQHRRQHLMGSLLLPWRIFFW